MRAVHSRAERERERESRLCHVISVSSRDPQLDQLSLRRVRPGQAGSCSRQSVSRVTGLPTTDSGGVDDENSLC